MKHLYHFTLLLFSACSSVAPVAAPDLNTIKIATKTIAFEDIAKEIKQTTLNYKNIYNKESQSVMGFPLEDVLNEFMGRNWTDMDALIFLARDGYKIQIPINKIKKYKPLLAYRFSDAQKAFTITIKKSGEEKPTELGPYYLVWDNIKYPELSSTKVGYDDWPYQVIQIDSLKHSSQIVDATTGKKNAEKY